MPKLFEGAAKNWRFVAKFAVFSVAFWLLEFLFQTTFVSPINLGFALVRSFGFSAATFISLALLSSVVFKFFPEFARYWHVRRSLGVMGYIFLSFHVFFAVRFFYNGNVFSAFFSLNPFENPVIFGAIANPVFFVMALTSTDWAVQKLGGKNWKAIHRLVYFAFFATVAHFLTINPPMLMNAAGYLLLLAAFLALAGELFWFVKTAAKNGFLTLGTKIGFLAILLYLIVAFIVFIAPAIAK